jgi:hypothetical protein
MSDSDDVYIQPGEYRPDARIPKLEPLHRAVDCADYASQEDFIEQGLPDLDRYTVPQLWALSGMLRDRGFDYLGKFISFYARQAEASVARAISYGPGETRRVGRRLTKHVRDYMPSPIRLWGDWRERQGQRAGWADGWKAAEKAAAPAPPESPPPKPTNARVTFLHDWNPTKPS